MNSFQIRTKYSHLNNFLDAFIEAALWSSTYEHEDCQACIEGQCNPSCDDGEYELSENSLVKLMMMAIPFYEKNSDLIEEAGNCLTDINADEQAGHDLWLTSQGHGVGFWETSDWKKDIGKILTDSARKMIKEGLHFYVNPEGEFDIE